MNVSVVVRSKDEAPRLRLTLASLAAQREPCEIVLVDDGSRDDTPEVAREWGGRENFVALRHDRPMGRSVASNAGAARASGDLLVFLDGDTLAGPQFVAAHGERHRARAGSVGRGATWNLRSTRPYLDPATGAPFPDQARRVAETPEAERTRARIDEALIATNFSEIEARAQPGVYPANGPRRLYDMEMDALRTQADCPALWAAASGANFSVPRDAFFSVGGFDPDIDLNAHREIALKLQLAGLQLVAVEAARSYHMIHRSGWRDPLGERDWERQFYRLHPISEVPLLAVLWGSFSEGLVPPAARILSLAALYAAARLCDGVSGVEAVRARHFENCAAAEIPAGRGARA